jgi:hypothetical protein
MHPKLKVDFCLFSNYFASFYLVQRAADTENHENCLVGLAESVNKILIQVKVVKMK